MQYKTSKKILIDKRKLDTLIRLKCPKEILINLILENKLTLTGDSLIDDNLESLIEIKEFENWGGFRRGAGRKQEKNHLENQDENQDENHLENQDANQVVDKDKDIDKDIDIDKDKDKDKDLSFNEDLFFDKNIQKVISLYKKYCNNLIPIGYEHRNRDRLLEIKEFLKIIEFDFNYITELFKKANKQKVFYSNKINLKSLIKNHDSIYSGLGASTLNEPQGSTNLDKAQKLKMELDALAEKYRNEDRLKELRSG